MRGSTLGLTNFLYRDCVRQSTAPPTILKVETT
nr:MAG TPA: hypothetical protein [Caudoviricetes sp.]